MSAYNMSIATGFIAFLGELLKQCSVVLMLRADESMIFANVISYNNDGVLYNVVNPETGNFEHQRITRWDMVSEIALADLCFQLEAGLAQRNLLNESLEQETEEPEFEPSCPEEPDALN